ncbi:MAG: hypothetical protein JJ975_09625 [Bacteroidia bacterium]|nr:hypothetical protein [Bacteroidia bacterium]
MFFVKYVAMTIIGHKLLFLSFKTPGLDGASQFLLHTICRFGVDAANAFEESKQEQG